MEVKAGFSGRGGSFCEKELLVIPITNRGAAVVDSGYRLRRNDVIHDVYVRIRTAEVTAGTKLIDVGILSAGADNDADGLGLGLSTAAIGLVPAGVVMTVGGTETYASSTTYGAQLMDFLAGANVVGDTGTVNQKKKVIAVDDARISYQLRSAHTQIVGEIYVVVTRMPD